MSGGPAVSPVYDIQYLVFQIFTFAPHPRGKVSPFNTTEVGQLVDDVIAAVGGLRGNATTRQLGFAVGPLTLDHSDAALRTTIRQSFRIALEKNVAVVFHIDDSMFWINQKELWQDPQNVEWSNWQGTAYKERIIGFSKVRLAPPMCYTSPAVRRHVGRMARDVIGQAITAELDILQRQNKAHLFGGVIAGWETRLEDDRQPRQTTGYCALSHRGFSASHPPEDIDAELEKIVHDWARFWSKNLYDAGVPRHRIYTHFPITKHKVHAKPWEAFNEYSRPGFTLSAARQNFEVIYRAVATHGPVPWANVEATNVKRRHFSIGHATRSAIPWEAYLGGSFQHGAALVNIFGWQDRRGVYGRTTRSDEAIAAYKKFLRGETLADLRDVSTDEVSTDLRAESLAAKVKTIHSELGRWIKTRGLKPDVERLVKKLDQYLKAGKPGEAEKIADQILGYLQGK